MMAMFHDYYEGSARVVTEAGATITLPNALLLSAGLRDLRSGQRLIVSLDADGMPHEVRLP